MNIDSSWDFKQLVYNLKMLKREYDFVLAFFLSCNDNVKIVNEYIRYVRDKLYSLNIKEWQIDICWEYMNGDKPYQEVVRIIKKIEK